MQKDTSIGSHIEKINKLCVKYNPAEDTYLSHSISNRQGIAVIFVAFFHCNLVLKTNEHKQPVQDRLGDPACCYIDAPPAARPPQGNRPTV